MSVLLRSCDLFSLDHRMEGLCKECNDDFKKPSKNKDKTLWKSAEKGHMDCLRAIIQALR